MKYIFTILFCLTSLLTFSQDDNTLKSKLPLYITIGSDGDFKSIYNRLNALTNHINETTTVVKRLDEIRQGQIIISTDNIGRSFNSINIDARPSLDLELQRVMFSGNFINPRGRFPIRIEN